jgi:hypothetical protein
VAPRYDAFGSMWAELVALVERARRRRQDVTDEGIAAVIAEALHAVRAPRRP